jgi:transcriptional regulator with XRE-family HTH domain
MLPWVNILSPKGLIRRSQAWCPFCYEEWSKSHAAVYNPLIWSLEVVSICPLHNNPLHQRCLYKDCNRLIPMLAPRSRPGYCSHCGRWLGRPHAETSANAATRLHFDDAEWRQWVAAQVAELIASTSQAQLSLQEDRFAEAVAAYLDEVMDNNISAAARRLQVSRRTIRDWKKGEQKPQFSSLLRFCYICGMSPLHLFIKNGSEAGFCNVSQIISRASSQKAKKHYRVFHIEKLKRTLEAELQSDEYPPPPMSRVAKKLGYDHSFLYKHLPELCRAISARFERYRAEQCEAKKRLLIREVRQATLEIHSQGIYPSQLQVRNLLAKPGSIRIPEALATWHATLKELGWRE